MDDLEIDWSALRSAEIEGAARAYVPYSHVRVGAADWMRRRRTEQCESESERSDEPQQRSRQGVVNGRVS